MPTRVRETRQGLRFRVGSLSAVAANGVADVSHMIDRTYDYASSRELRWHLAERFGVAPADVVLDRSH